MTRIIQGVSRKQYSLGKEGTSMRRRGPRWGGDVAGVLGKFVQTLPTALASRMLSPPAVDEGP
jgi:hypothetical protein